MMIDAVQQRKAHRGSVAYHAGLAAEGRIAQDYERRGFAVARQRWRGKSGEIDLIVRDGDGLIFIEVKQSRNFERAALSLGAAQMRNLTDVRFDVALVNGHGETQIIENAFGHC